MSSVSAEQGFRLSPQQRRVWGLAQGGAAGCAQGVIAIEGDLDAERLRHAVGEVVGRHEILRTVFRGPAGAPVPYQVVEAALASSWADFDLQDLPVSRQEERINELLRGQARDFDFGRGPLLRLALLRLAPSRHKLLATTPALCADAASLQVIVNEVSHFYGGGAAGALGEPVQYADYAEFQNQLLESGDEMAERGRELWRVRERSQVPPPALPFEAGPGRRPAQAPEYIGLGLRADLAAEVMRLARGQGTTAEVVLLAAWQSLLHRLARAEEIVVGWTGSGRKYEDLERAVGPMAKSLPLGLRFEDGVRFSDLLARTRRERDDAVEWEDYWAGGPFGNVDGGAFPAVGFEYAEFAAPAGAAGVSFAVVDYRACAERFKVKLSGVAVGDDLKLGLYYDPQIFRRDSVERIARYFVTLLGSAVARPEAEVSRLEILDPAERHTVLAGWNATVADYPRDKCLHQLFEEQAERTPGCDAVVAGDERLTYAELNERANQLADELRRKGIAPDVPVGLCAGRSAGAIVGLLGIMKAGGAYVPLNPEHPKARLLHQLSDAGVRVLVTEENLLGALPDFGGEVVCLDRDRAALEGRRGEDLAPVNSPSDLAYIIYTSGSTGSPKGVAVSHRSLVNYTHHIARRLLAGAGEEALSFAVVSTITADLGNTCIFPSLVSGGCLHVISYEVAMDGEKFADHLRRRPVDVLKIVPSHLRALLSSGAGADLLPRKYLILGGETFPAGLAEELSAFPKKCEVINHYGPTETTVGSLTFDLSADRVASMDSVSVPVGRPISNTEVYILDRHLQPTPVGVPGELYIGGDGLARGYLNRPELTQEKFVAHPFSGEAGARLYKTGDAARYLPGGEVEFLGRLDHQVKIRGYRVELGEVEALLRRHPSVRECAVLLRQDEPGDERLVAYLACADSGGGMVEQLRGYLSEQLPDYMMPSAYVMLPSLPLTRNGKLDRASLPRPAEARPAGGGAPTAPRSDLERAIAAVWQEVLGVEQVGVEDNFFDLGGHSLLLIKVNSRLREVASGAGGLSIIDFFRYPTIGSLAAHLSGGQPERTAAQPDHGRGEARREALQRQRQSRQERRRGNA